MSVIPKPLANLIMPMAGRGSRFSSKGFTCPKPLIDLGGRPFFWWATESIRRAFDLRSTVYAVLAEHVRDHAMDRRIHAFYPDAAIVVLPDVTKGALETALRGVDRIGNDLPVIINDCDHAFDSLALANASAAQELPAGMLCHFRAAQPIYSYAAYDENGLLLRTAEKVAISDMAIAGAYWFRNATLLRRYAQIYIDECPYDELFVSGIYNQMAKAGEPVRGVMLARHIPFGVVSEYEIALNAIKDFAPWINRS